MVKNNCKNIEKLIFRYVNQTRKKNNLPELKPDRGLIFLSRRHSSLMAKKERSGMEKMFLSQRIMFQLLFGKF